MDVASQKLPPVIPMFVITKPALQASKAFAALYSAPTIMTGVAVGVVLGVGVGVVNVLQRAKSVSSPTVST